jgi:hypothetical protein
MPLKEAEAERQPKLFAERMSIIPHGFSFDADKPAVGASERLMHGQATAVEATTAGERLLKTMFRSNINTACTKDFMARFIKLYAPGVNIDEHAILSILGADDVVTSEMLDSTLFAAGTHTRNVSKLYIQAIIENLVTEFKVNSISDCIRIGKLYLNGTTLLPKDENVHPYNHSAHIPSS